MYAVILPQGSTYSPVRDRSHVLRACEYTEVWTLLALTWAKDSPILKKC